MATPRTAANGTAGLEHRGEGEGVLPGGEKLAHCPPHLPCVPCAACSKGSAASTYSFPILVLHHSLGKGMTQAGADQTQFDDRSQ